MKKIMLTILAGLLVSCGLTNTKKEEASSEASRKEVSVPVNVDYAEKMGLALLLGQLPHVIEISGCISFNAGETKTVQYLNINDDQASTVADKLPGQVDETVNETGANNANVKGTINLYLGDTGCESDLIRFRHEGQWYEKSSSDQPPANTGMVLYRAIDVPAKDSKEFWIQNLSDLDQIDNATDTQIKFAVWKSFERNQIESSINVETEHDDHASTLDDRDHGRFDIVSVTQAYMAQERRERVTFRLRCAVREDQTETATSLKCNDSDVNLTIAADDTANDTRFYVFKRDESKTSFSIQEIIDHVASRNVGSNEDLPSGSSLISAFIFRCSSISYHPVML